MGGWTQFDLGRDNLQGVPELPGLVRTTVGEETVEVVTGGLRRALRRMRSDFRDIAADPAFTVALVDWWQAPASVLEQRIADARGQGGGLHGEPIKIPAAHPVQIPAVWGLYKIRRLADETWYVGVTSNLRVRLATHRRSGLYDPDGGDEVELIPARARGGHAVVVWEDLQRAERAHIAELRRTGLLVRNVTAGGNGRPPNQRFEGDLSSGPAPFARRRPRRLHASEWHSVGADEAPIPGTGKPEVRLGIVLYERENDWNLWLDQEGQIRAAGKGHGPFTRISTASTVSGSWLRAEYAAETGGRDLDRDLSALPWSPLGTGDIPLYYWKPKRPLLNDEGEPRTSPAALIGVRPEHVRDRKLPSGLREQGFNIDPGFGRRNNLNEIVRVTSEHGSSVYLKTERSVTAVRAEVLISLLWNRLDWPGLAGRVIGDETGLLLKIPALGGGGVVDKGNFATYFAWRPQEDPSTMKTARAFVLKRVSLQDLQLRDTWDALRFLLVNAVTGNTDRHRENIHYGLDDAAARRSGYLLPIDHGQCLFNNSMPDGDCIAGSPADAITGALGNPHQLLRPVVELLDESYETALAVATAFLQRLYGVIARIHNDPAWGVTYDAELQALSARCLHLTDDLDGFFEACERVVVR